MKIIEFRFTAESNHSIAETGFSSNKKISISSESLIKDGIFLGYKLESLSIITAESVYQVKVVFEEEVSISTAAHFVEAFEVYLTFLFSYDKNLYYGVFYAKVDYADFYKKNSEGLSEHLHIESKWHFNASERALTQGTLHPLMYYFFLGMQSNNYKAAFFNLFVILEAIEGSLLYKKINEDGTLFSEVEKEIIKQAATQMKTPHKISVVNQVLKRTSATRNEKLLETLKHIGVLDVEGPTGHRSPLTLAIIKSLTDSRNALFHSSSSFDESLIVKSLLPITRRIMEILDMNPLIFESVSA